MYTPNYSYGKNIFRTNNKILLTLYASLVLLALGLNATKANADEWVYTVHSEDTLWSIAEHFLTKGTDYTSRLQALNQIKDPFKIPPGTRIKIPVSWLSQQPAPAFVLKVQGKCQGYAKAKGFYDLSPGMKLYADDVILVDQNANATLEFADGSRLLIQEKSELVLDAVSIYGDTGMVDTRLRLRKGNVDTRVTPKTGAGSRYEISTPSAIAAVRGTEFRVNADVLSDSMRNEVLKGNVLLSAEGASQSVPEGFGIFLRTGEKPSAPIKLLPPVDVTSLPDVLQYLPLHLSWPSMPNAKKYRLQVAPNNSFEELLIDTVVEKPEIHMKELADGRYALRLRGIDALGLEGLNAERLFNVHARPEPPMPLNPKDKASVYEPQPKLWWSKPKNIVSYHFQLSKDEDFSNLLIDQPNYNESSLIPAQPLPLGVYYWRVASYDAVGAAGPYFQQLMFSIKEKPVAPEALAPGIDESQINFQWKEDPEAAKYQFQLSDSDDFDELIVDQEIIKNEYTQPIADLAGSYYFRIRTFNADGVPGPFCTTQEVELPGGISPYWSSLLLLGLIPLLL